MGRLRDNLKSGKQQGGIPVEVDKFVNPFSYESQPEARVQLELENRHIPFSYRYFDGNAPTLKHLIPDYAPEFTLREYRVTIVIVGNFYGSLPGAIDRAALASVLLQRDGWRQVIWLETEIIQDGVATLITRDLPQLVNPSIQGAERPSPVGHPLTMETRRKWLRGLALLRALFTPKTVEAAGGRSSGYRRKFIRRRRGDVGRIRAHDAAHRGVAE